MIHYNALVVFTLSCVSIIPLAAIIGDATEQVAHYTGDKIGGLLNATMGNVPELLIGLFAIKAGLYDVVKATIVGSMLGNLLFVLGLSVLVGGIKYPIQNFNKSAARSNFIMLFYSMISIIIPAAFFYTSYHNENAKLNSMSIAVAILMLLVYISGLIYSLYTHKNIFTSHDDIEDGVDAEAPKWSLLKAGVILSVVTLFVGYESEILVGQLEEVIKVYHLPQTFIGIIIIPIVGNVAEHAAAIIMAYKNRMDLALEIGVGSATQIALFVGPILLLSSFVFGNPMNYFFAPFHIVALILAFGISLYVFEDGKTSWLEGLIMLFTYTLFAVTYFFV